MKLYANPDREDHIENNAAFLRVVSEFQGLKMFQPSPEKAPWHVQVVIDGKSPQLINFWPHIIKGQRDGLKAVKGAESIRGIIMGAIEDAREQPFDLIED